MSLEFALDDICLPSMCLYYCQCHPDSLSILDHAVDAVFNAIDVVYNAVHAVSNAVDTVSIGVDAISSAVDTAVILCLYLDMNAIDDVQAERREATVDCAV